MCVCMCMYVYVCVCVCICVLENTVKSGMTELPHSRVLQLE